MASRDKIKIIAQMLGNQLPDSPFRDRYVDLLTDAIDASIYKYLNEDELTRYLQAVELMISIDTHKVNKMTSFVTSEVLSKLEKEMNNG